MTLYIANTQFEAELSNTVKLTPITLQLQFLPFLYASPGDGVAAIGEPPDSYWETLKKEGIRAVRLHSFATEEPLPYSRVVSWGASLTIAEWAKKHRISYFMPPWDVVREVNSKAFSFMRAPQLPGSALLYTENELIAWLKEQKKTSVLKTCFGVSGKGHLLIDPRSPPFMKRILAFCEAEWKEKRPLIAEPWMARVLDFSTQWEIFQDKNIVYIGSTVCENDEKGQYRSNRVGEERRIFGSHYPFLEQHRRIAFPLLEEIAQKGYFGYVGLDAMIYGPLPTLHPVVEVNARQTMGLVALKMRELHFPQETLTLSYVKAREEGLLPPSLIFPDKHSLSFTRQLMLFRKH